MKLSIPPFWRKSYHLFLLMVVVPFIIVAINTNKSYDFHIHDTYFVVARIHMALGIGLPFFFTWLTYMMAEKVLLSTYLTWLHFVATIVAVSGFIVLEQYSPAQDSQMPGRYYTYELPVNTMTYLLPLFIFFIIGQVAFLINVIGGLIWSLIHPAPPPFIENI